MSNRKMVRQLSIFICLTLISIAQVAFAESDLVQINSHGSKFEAPYIIYNPEGKRLGHDPRTNKYFDEFSGGYGTTGLGCNECEDSTPLTHESMFHLIEGEYKIEVLGKGLSAYRLGMFISAENEFKTLDVVGVVDENGSSTFKFTYRLNKSALWTITRLASPSSLRQDIELSRKIGWIDNDGIVTSLLKKLDAAEAAIERDKEKTAENQLNALIKEVHAQAGKHITKEAVTMLIEDANYIIEHLYDEQ